MTELEQLSETIKSLLSKVDWAVNRIQELEAEKESSKKLVLDYAKLSEANQKYWIERCAALEAGLREIEAIYQSARSGKISDPAVDMRNVAMALLAPQSGSQKCPNENESWHRQASSDGDCSGCAEAPALAWDGIEDIEVWRKRVNAELAKNMIPKAPASRDEQ